MIAISTLNSHALLSLDLQARVNVPDDRFTWLCDVYKPKSQVPAFLDVCDIAGLVK
jgi:ribosome-binding ATPase YchF (GTP1/OBG family)